MENKMKELHESRYSDLTEAPIHWSVKFGKGVGIGHYVTIGENCVIGDNVMIGDGTHIGSNVNIGNETVIGHNVVIESGTLVENNITIHSQCHITKNCESFTSYAVNPAQAIPVKIDPVHKQRPESYYNKGYSKNKEYLKHYKDSVYYPVWTKLAENLDLNESILDIGCGPGQLAKMLFDAGIKKYVGIDFSREAIKMAKKMCPDFIFIHANIIKTGFIETLFYNTVIATEFFEHINKDISIFKRLSQKNRKIKIIFSLPDFLSKNHVRCFKNHDEIYKRYQSFLDSMNIVTINFEKTKIFLVIGIIK